MVTLRFLAKGDYLSEVADTHGISLSSASRIIHIVCSLLCLCLDNIRFPTSQQELKKVKDEFFNKQGFPNVAGAIDGTLVPIQGMAGDEEPSFICRKGFHAINILCFTNIAVRWPGSTHDSFILANSFLPQIMRGVNGWFLGDSGFPLKKWLLTPFAQPSNQQEQWTNSSHCSTRNTVERAFGILKSRFRCLHKTGGSLQFRTKKCINITECCFRLHNKAISERVPLQAGNNAVPVYHNHDLYNGNDNDGFALRQRIVQRF